MYFLSIFFKRAVFIAALFVFLSCGFAVMAQGNDDHAKLSSISAEIYEDGNPAVFQIRVIDKSSGEKSTIGSGFVVSQDNKFITNYHVVSQVVKTPDRYDVKYLHENGEEGEMRILAIDVVNDLALLQADEDIEPFLVIAQEGTLKKGDRLYSMGNPHDLGMMIIEGVYNGLYADTFYEKIIFSGTLNPGMSGGPSFNSNGEVIGVNVAKKGDDIGYLVPAKFIRDLMDLGQAQTQEGEKDWDAMIEHQILANQERIFGGILQNQWDTQNLEQLSFPKNISPAIKCWGNGHAENELKHHSHSWVTCQSENAIYVSSDFNTGSIAYYVEKFESERLSEAGFSKYYTERFGNPAVYVGYRIEEDASKFECENSFLEIAGAPWKTVICARRYKKMPSLYDTFISAARLSDQKVAYVAQINLQAVTKKNAMSFYQRFLSHVDEQSE